MQYQSSLRANDGTFTQQTHNLMHGKAEPAVSL